MDRFNSVLKVAQGVPIDIIVQMSTESFSREEQRSRAAMNARLAKMTINQLECVVHRHHQHRDATFMDGCNIQMELGKYSMEILRAACNRASHPITGRQSKQGIISDIAAMAPDVQNVIRLSVGEEKRKQEAERKCRVDDRRKRKWETNHDAGVKRQRVDAEDGQSATFMEPVDDSVLKERISKFIARTDNEALKTAACGSCARERPFLDVETVPLMDIPNIDLLKPSTYHESHDLTHGLLLHKPRTTMGTSYPISANKDEVEVIVCKDCLRDLRKGRIPLLSLANNMWLGDIPHELRVLSLPESVLVARYFPAAHIVKLYPKAKGAKYWDHDILNSAVKGNVSTYWLDPDSVSNMLDGRTFPPSADILAATIGVTIIGPQNLPEKTLPGFLRVRRERVRRALLWLKANNPLYRDIIISDENLDLLPEDGVPRQIIETTRYSSDTSALDQERSGYVVSDEDDTNGHDDREFVRGVPMDRGGECHTGFISELPE